MLEDFDIGKPLGRGQQFSDIIFPMASIFPDHVALCCTGKFGSVYLAREKKSKFVVALKVNTPVSYQDCLRWSLGMRLFVLSLTSRSTCNSVILEISSLLSYSKVTHHARLGCCLILHRLTLRELSSQGPNTKQAPMGVEDSQEQMGTCPS